jgi:hypothetical protein
VRCLPTSSTRKIPVFLLPNPTTLLELALCIRGVLRLPQRDPGARRWCWPLTQAFFLIFFFLLAVNDRIHGSRPRNHPGPRRTYGGGIGHVSSLTWVFLTHVSSSPAAMTVPP